jgi:hypothetical protein
MDAPGFHAKSEKSGIPQVPEPTPVESEDVIAPLSSIRSVQRRISLGIIFISCLLTYIDESIHAPPSFAESQFAAIVRRQRPHTTALKISNVPTRYPNLPRDFEFAGYATDITPPLTHLDGDL